MSIAADRRILVLLTVVALAIIVLSLLSFEVVTHFAVIWQMVHGMADSGSNIMNHHP